MYATRIIEVDYQRLVNGDPNLDVVVRPGDRIYVEPPDTGFLYIDGEINRVGVYELQNTNGRLTLSRFVSAAGGLAPTAIPTRVDLVRMLGNDREATIRIDLAAIRNRSEPDIYMQANDHVIIGTNLIATPLAVIRNGFRMTYGFGFLLDRNFGNDVFGPPPESSPFF
jgi:protein involved in polysaccharide export with SLBB domain